LSIGIAAPTLKPNGWRPEDRGEQQDHGHAKGDREERERDAELLVVVHHRGLSETQWPECVKRRCGALCARADSHTAGNPMNLNGLHPPRPPP